MSNIIHTFSEIFVEPEDFNNKTYNKNRRNYITLKFFSAFSSSFTKSSFTSALTTNTVRRSDSVNCLLLKRWSTWSNVSTVVNRTNPVEISSRSVSEMSSLFWSILRSDDFLRSNSASFTSNSLYNWFKI